MAEKAPAEPGEPPAVTSLSIAESATANPTEAKATEQKIDPWSVSAATDAQGNVLAFDYEAISKKWNTKLLDQPLLERFERLTGHKPHRWLRRGLFFSHRDLDRILDVYERGEDFFLYTGRGPSSDNIHIGHTIPFEFTKWLQDVFDVPLVIMLTDDEKALFKDSLTFEETMQFGRDNAKDIIAIGFDVKKTFIYSDLKYLSMGGHHMLLNAWEFSKAVNFNQVRGAFGFDQSTNTGRIFFPNLQCVAAFGSSYPQVWGHDAASDLRSKKLAAIPCLIPCAIDQDPYFRLVRDNAHRMRFPSPKPALLHSKFLTALQGAGGKMSASNPNSAIFMSDTKKQIQNKINRHAFSGGQETLELHRQLGGNPDVDVAYQYLTYFEDDDAKLDNFAAKYRAGEMLTGEMKKECIKLMQAYVANFQEARAKVTDEILAEFMRPRKLEWGARKVARKERGEAVPPKGTEGN
ncbi:putative tryptophanyl-tRNA synthetase [Lineolata rhizophorae]|uniref:Tryptophan--tRNA ligase, cytoplasmic n=1 Tax=Lineolata rhizophorae TaxID=578093 RepID=A0A6A6P4X6_9PEZI|nr:putative tryptophanyl-tRNA synthetase [Lineolata rhizophorae]